MIPEFDISKLSSPGLSSETMHHGFFLGPSNITQPPEDLHFQDAQYGGHEPSPAGSFCSSQQNDGLQDVLPSSDNASQATAATCLDEKMPCDDGSIAFGTIRLYDANGKTWIKGRSRDDIYPHMLISQGLSNHWIRYDELFLGIKGKYTRVRVYVLPEDVKRSQRGSLKDYHKVIAYMIPFIDRSLEAWQGTDRFAVPSQLYEIPTCADEESLFYIFNTLDSPTPDLAGYRDDGYGMKAITDVFDDRVCGLKTQLYEYQKRSIAVMIRKEADPRKLGDPRKVQMEDVYGTQFFLDVQSGALCKEQTFYTEPRGGILAETMGYGKTLICLALILATRGHYPEVPPNRIDEVSLQPQERTGSLLSMAARKLRHEGLSWKTEFYELSKAGYHYAKCIDELQKLDRPYFEPIYTPTTPRRHNVHRVSGIKIHLCSTTLVIVPPNLIIQWQHEITKHIEDGALDILVITDSKTEVPRWTELCKNDIVLMSKTRFEQEYRDDDLHTGKVMRGQTEYRSPLTDVRWLRVICDEGHGFAGASRKTNATAMLDKMFIERRWVVSGTPSNTLHGVEVGLATDRIHEIENGTLPVTPRQVSIDTALETGKVPTHGVAEAKDLERLRLIVVNFLKLQPWANGKGSGDRADWKTYLAPRMRSDGAKCSVPALREVMQSLIVRHRIEDIDLDLQLPPLYNRVTCLTPSYHDKITMNNFIMSLVSNYVTSEREDEDYMFHPKNRKKLDLLIANMRNATFHWVGWTDEMLRETIRVSQKYMSEKFEKVGDKDRILLVQAIINGERALADSSWQAMSKLHEIGVYISQFPEAAREAWALDGVNDNPLLVGTTQARAVQKHVGEQVVKGHGADEDLVGAGIKAMAAANKKSVVEDKAKTPANSESPKSRKGTDTADAPKIRGGLSASTASRRLSSTVDSPTRLDSGAIPLTPITATSKPQPTPALPPSKIVGFSSSKLTYIMHRILHEHPDEKTIIFYSHNNTAYFIADALELLSISFRIYANTLPTTTRAQYLAQFSTDQGHSDEIKVLLMDLKQAGQGLHIAAASRVYIVNPIWDRAVESQAIKRAHRIGQTRPVYVETLVLKDTFEEALIRRRNDKDAQPGLNGGEWPEHITTTDTINTANPGKALLDDTAIVGILKNIQFLPFTDDEEKCVRLQHPIPLFRLPAATEQLISPASRRRVSNSAIFSDLPAKRRGPTPSVSSAKRVKIAGAAAVLEQLS